MYNKAATEINGPKGISSFLFFSFVINNTADTIEPITNEKNTINKTPLKPNIKPNAAISLISPPPMALVANAIEKNNIKPVNTPNNLSDIIN